MQFSLGRLFEARSSKAFEDTEKDVEKLKQDSMKRKFSATEEFKAEKKLKQDALEDVLRDEEKQNQSSNPATYLLNLYLDIPYVGSNLVLRFDSSNNVGSFITPDGIIENSVLQLGEYSNL